MAPTPDALALDSRLRCGVTFGGLTRESALGEARRIERLGFDSLWATDHLAFHVPIAESLALLAFAAAATERVTLGTSVYLLPLRPPFLVAKTAATVDALSGGRLVLGVGVGGEHPPEFEAVGVPVRERGARVDEAIPLLRRLWSEPRVLHEGRHFRFGPLPLEPPPARAGGPPIWVGGRSPAALRRAGRLGDGYVSVMATPERYGEQLETIARHAEEAGRDAPAFATAAYLFAVLDDRFETARARAEGALSRVYGRAVGPDAAERYCLLGRPEDFRARMHRFADAGVRHFVLAPLEDPGPFAETVAAEVLPELRARTP